MNGFRGAMHSIPTSTGMYPCPLIGQATSTEVNNDTRLRATSTPTVDHEPPSPMPSPIALNTTHDHEVDFQGATRLSFAGSISSIEESNGSSLVQLPIPVVQHNNNVLPWRPGCYLPYPLIEQKAELSSLEQNQRASSVIVTTNDSSTSHKDDDNASNATAMQGSQMEALLVMQSSAEERTARKAAEAERLEFTSPPPTYTYRWGDSNFQDSRDSTAMESSAEHENCAGTFSDTRSDPPRQNNKSPEEDDDEATSIPYRTRAAIADIALNTTADSSFSTAKPIDLEEQRLAGVRSTVHWTEGKRVNSSIKIYAIRAEVSQPLLDEGKSDIDACNIYAQTKPKGLFELYSRRTGDHGSRIVDILRMNKHDATISTAAKEAFSNVNGRLRSIEIPGGSKGEPRDEKSAPTAVYEDENGVRRGSGKYCVPDGLYNVMKAHHPDLLLIPSSEEKEDESTAAFVDTGIYLTCTNDYFLLY
mmetsp:Transcript_30373/g.67319  ORF Transcript_30373/g.67319 Transcript_30373/m.67319 type:complete len:475 (-) Transcript_30373:40-1464(-)